MFAFFIVGDKIWRLNVIGWIKIFYSDLREETSGNIHFVNKDYPPFSFLIGKEITFLSRSKVYLSCSNLKFKKIPGGCEISFLFNKNAYI